MELRVATRYKSVLTCFRYSRLKTQYTHIRPTIPPITTKESTIMARFCNQLKLDDQNRIWINMKAAQKMPARIDTTIGMNGFFSFSIVVMHLHRKWF